MDEDVYKRVIGDKCNGVFLDIGANDGVTYSNSFFFEESLQWRGICVEPNPLTFEKLKKNRPDCINYNIGAGEKPETLTFIKGGEDGMLSGFKKSNIHIGRMEQEYKNGVAPKPEEIEVKVITIKEILNSNNINYVDFMNLDCEGHELDVVKGMDFQNHFVKYILSENPDVGHFLISKGYKIHSKVRGGHDTLFER